jgi:hypothetical protein
VLKREPLNRQPQARGTRATKTPSSGPDQGLLALRRRRRAVSVQAQQKPERALGAGPVLAKEVTSGAPEQRAKGHGHEHRVVELAGDGEEVRHQVDGSRR